MEFILEQKGGWTSVLEI